MGEADQVVGGRGRPGGVMGEADQERQTRWCDGRGKSGVCGWNRKEERSYLFPSLTR